MKLPVHILEWNIKKKNFEWDKTHLEVLLYVKNKYIVPISAENLNIHLISKKNKILVKASINNIKISALGTENIIINVLIENKETAEFIYDFFNLKKSFVTLKMLSGKVKIFSILKINLANKTKDLDVFNLIKSLSK
ncbi:hypothetical protein [Brachyspira innocens]|uniref:hypothetical protein n=1 Tax=Brachyspira innocens TaxID=13264 RepID=UPI00036437F6|nr:hypothetical protein [Brachyspira innocens]